MILIALAGGAGAVCRTFLDGFVMRRLHGFPWGTVAVNALGCFLVGLANGVSSPELTLGFFGGFTTFSTAMLDSVNLALSERKLAALGDVLGMFAVSTAFLFLGKTLAPFA